MSDRGRTRLAAHGLCVDDDRLLMVRLAPPVPEAGCWGLPGGGIDWGEAPEDALVREVGEETGLRAVVAGVAGVYSTTFARSRERPAEPLHFISIVHWMTVSGGALTHEEGGTTDLAAWVPLADTATAPLGALAEFGLHLVHRRSTAG